LEAAGGIPQDAGGILVAELMVYQLSHRYSPGWQELWDLLDEAEPLLHLNALSMEYELTVGDGTEV
jgi:hypothetical protein